MKALSLMWMTAALYAADGAYVQVTLERLDGVDWHAVDPRTILEQKDKIRFRFQTGFPGYLYVFNRASDGTTEKLFPAESADNKVEPGRSYLVPAGGANFVIEGPAGYDITHWIVAPEPLAALPTGSSLPKADLPGGLLPRCREGGLRPRGGCLDDRAGPQPAKDSSLKARNIRIEKNADARISAPEASNEKMRTIVYEFRVAHQ